MKKKIKKSTTLMNSKPFTSLKRLQEIRGLSIQMIINAAFDYRLGEYSENIELPGD